jgi:hypothetical protein
VNKGFQGSVKSPMNKGRAWKIPGCGLAGDWPGSWTQTFAQVDTEAGPHGFDENYFHAQVAGLSQITGEFMQVNPKVIELAWGEIKTSITTLADTDFASASDAAAHRKTLLDQYFAAFRQVEAAKHEDAGRALKDLSANVATWVAPDKQAAIAKHIDDQRAKLT